MISFEPKYVKMVGSINSALLLCYLQQCSADNGGRYFKRSMQEINTDTGLSRDQQDTAMKILVDYGLIDKEHNRLQHEMWYIFNHHVLGTMIENRIK